jgi:gamma-glutamyltranspeptidase/glutathione hydrolase
MAENAATARRRAWSARFAGAIGLGLAFAIASPASLAESGKPVAAQDRMVVAAHPLAAQTGLMVLRAGGNAVDAAVAMQMVLTLVEPQSSGIGGGGFLLHYDAKTGALSFHDGRETAPARATADMFLDATGNPRPFGDVVAGGLSVGVPGAVEMLEALHREHGRLPWARLFDDAVRLSEQGFPVSPRLARMIASDEALRRSPTARRYFFDAQGRPWPAGATLRNPALAASFRLIAAGGSDAFYRGQLAHEIVRAVAASPVNPGRLSLADLARYQAREREAVCTDYRAWRVCSAPPPSSGGIAVLQVLELLERFDLARIDPGSAVATHLFAEANRLAFADRNFYVADPDFRKVPTLDLLDSGYLAGRSQSIPFGRAIWKVTPGVLPNQTGLAAPLPQAESDSTTHTGSRS